MVFTADSGACDCGPWWWYQSPAPTQNEGGCCCCCCGSNGKCHGDDLNCNGDTSCKCDGDCGEAGAIIVVIAIVVIVLFAFIGLIYGLVFVSVLLQRWVPPPHPTAY